MRTAQGEGEARYIPALPTVEPSMLWRAGGPMAALPFSAPRRRFVYLARNAVWQGARLLGLQEGEVLVPAYHHGVEVEALAAAGAGLRFYPVGSGWEVDPDQVASRVGPRTRAIYLIHFAGFPGPAAALRELAERRGLALLEDCALSLLSCDGTAPLGSAGDVSVFCLYKTLPVPHGGALVLNRPDLAWPPDGSVPPVAATLRHLGASWLQRVELRGGALGRALRRAARGAGRKGAKWGRLAHVPTGTSRFEHRHLELGMSPLALRLCQAQEPGRIVAARRRNYFFLLGRLREHARPVRTELAAGVCPLFYPLRVDDKQGVLRQLWAAGVEAVDFWSAFHPSCPAGEFPEVARLRRELIELPCHQDLGPEDLEHLVAATRAALRRQARRPASDVG